MTPREPPAGSGRRLKNNLVALGSAAVLTVYAAGYARTRSAAQRFAVEDAERRPAAPMADPARALPAAPPVLGARQAATSEEARPPAASKQASAATPEPVAAPSAAQAAKAADSTAVASTPAVEVPPAPAPVSASAPAPATPTETVPPAAPAAATATDTAASADHQRAGWKDGIYTGWGTSRHGDIEAAVEITNGKITSAFISQCLTRYPCSWISRLPPQVVERQSAQVDYVSGATQSTNAFYYAVMEALSKAKAF